MHINAVRMVSASLQSMMRCAGTPSVICTEAVRKLILDAHNQVRRESPSTGSFELSWDPIIERLAQEWTEKCFYRGPGYKAGEKERYLSTESERGTWLTAKLP